MWTYNDNFSVPPKYKHVQKVQMEMQIRNRLKSSIHTKYSTARTGVNYAAKPKFKKTTIDANKPDVLNPIDYKHLQEDAE